MKGMIVVKVDKCLACKSCEMACAVEHSQSRDLYQAIHEQDRPKARVKVEQGENFAIPLQCRHCEHAPCVCVCPTKALSRHDQDSPVLVDHDLCVGCKWCILACPFGVISLDSSGRSVIKCDQCFQRVQNGELPACVIACPTGALEYKTIDEVIAEKRQTALVQIERGLAGDDK